MRSCKSYFRDFLTSLMCENTGEETGQFRDLRIKMNMLKEETTVSGFNQTMSVTPDFNVRFSTITNCMEVPRGDCTVLFATVHHLYAIDENQELFPFVFGGKYRFVYNWKEGAPEEAAFDLEYLAGNSYLTRGSWIPLGERNRQITGEELRAGEDSGISLEGTVYRFFWALDTEDEALFRENVSPDIQITRAGVDGDSYGMTNVSQTAAFMAADKQYYSQNQYSVHIDRTEFADDTHAVVYALRLYPADTGNKHRGSQNKFSQFYNEILTLELEKSDRWKVRSAVFKRKENPVPYGYRVLEL